jgi:uncharacterized repeat protein (TIGR03803 family)
LILSGNTLYGTTYGGGSGAGTVFAIKTNGTSFTTLYRFTGGSDGANPDAGLTLAGNTLYGTTYGGGSGAGTVFAIGTNGTGFTTLYRFTGGSDGSTPVAGLILSGNTLYGTATVGGSSSDGTVFAIGTNGTGFTILYSFTGAADGANPEGGLIINGNTLFGTANGGGSSGYGTIFQVNTDGTDFANLYNFIGNADGAYPEAGVILLGNTLYGTAELGGSSGDGAVFNFVLPPTVNSTAVASSSDPSVYGQSGVTFTATVTGNRGTPTGSVQFKTNGVNFGSAVTLSGGSASSVALPTTLLTNTYAVTALYSGDATYNASSGTLSGGQTVNRAASSTAVSSSDAGLSSYGQSTVMFTATVSDSSSGSSGTPTGTVQFLTNGVNFGSAVTLSGGSASSGVLPAALPPGSYAVTAAYSGDSNFLTSTGTLNGGQTENKAGSLTAVSSSDGGTSVYGQSGVTFTATVTDISSGSTGTPTGTVQFQTNGVNFGGAVTLSGGTASSGALPASLPAGNYTVTAAYSGDVNFNTSSGTLSGGQTVKGQPVITSISVSGTTLRITATGGVPNGTYTLWESSKVTTPVAEWTSLGTGTFDNNGDLNLSENLVVPGNPHEFYILSQ